MTYVSSLLLLCQYVYVESEKKKKSYRNSFSSKKVWILPYLLFIRLDIRTHLMVNYQISFDVYSVNLWIKSDFELSEGIWHSSDIYLTSFWWIKDSVNCKMFFKFNWLFQLPSAFLFNSDHLIHCTSQFKLY